MNLSKHLTLSEATKSATAIRRGIHNIPPDFHLAALVNIAENVFERQKKYKSLKKYQKGEEKAIKILAPLLKKVIFHKNF